MNECKPGIRATPAIGPLFATLLLAVLSACGSATPAVQENVGAEGVDQAPAASTLTTSSADPTPSPFTRVGQPTASPETPTDRRTDIRDVDFQNGFVYEANQWSPEPVEVTDGQFINGEVGDPEFFAFVAQPPVFGDLDGDGSEEAVVHTTWNGGGSGNFDSLHVFSIIADGQAGDGVVALDQRAFGDRAFGGIWSVDIDDEQLVVDVFTNGAGSCCPHSVVRELYTLDAYGLILVTSFAEVRWVAPTSTNAAGDIEEVEFLPGTSAAILDLWLVAAEHTVSLDAAADQWLSLRQFDGPAAVSSKLVHTNSGAEVALAGSDGGIAQLPESGLWRLEIQFDSSDAITFDDASAPLSGSAKFVLSIGDEQLAHRSASATLLGTQTRRVVVQDEPPIVATASWPDFGTTDFGLFAGEVHEWVNQPVDTWIAYAVESLPLPRDEGGEYDLHYQVTLVTEDLVSINFSSYEYLCCRPYPNLGQRSLIVDTTHRRIIGDGEIVDLTRLDEIEAVWLAALAADEEFAIGATEADELFAGSDEPGWGSLTLASGGLVFGTNRQGVVPPMSTFVSFADLGDLVSPELVRQAAAGTVPLGF